MCVCVRERERERERESARERERQTDRHKNRETEIIEIKSNMKAIGWIQGTKGGDMPPVSKITEYCFLVKDAWFFF